MRGTARAIYVIATRAMCMIAGVNLIEFLNDIESVYKPNEAVTLADSLILAVWAIFINMAVEIKKAYDKPGWQTSKTI